MLDVDGSEELGERVNAGVVLQTFPRKICNIADFPSGRSATLQTFPKGEGLQYCIASLFHCRSSPGEGLQCCRPSPIFVKFWILILGCIEERGLKL